MIQSNQHTHTKIESLKMNERYKPHPNKEPTEWKHNKPIIHWIKFLMNDRLEFIQSKVNHTQTNVNNWQKWYWQRNHIILLFPKQNQKRNVCYNKKLKCYLKRIEKRNSTLNANAHPMKNKVEIPNQYQTRRVMYTFYTRLKSSQSHFIHSFIHLMIQTNKKLNPIQWHW